MLCCVLWLWIFLICFLMACTTTSITRSQGVKESSFPWYSQTWNKTFHGLLSRTICKFGAPEIWEFHLHIWTYCCRPSGQPSSISKFSASFLGWVSWCHEESFWMRSRIPLPVKYNLYICLFFLWFFKQFIATCWVTLWLSDWKYDFKAFATFELDKQCLVWLWFWGNISMIRGFVKSPELGCCAALWAAVRHFHWAHPLAISRLCTLVLSVRSRLIEPMHRNKPNITYLLTRLRSRPWILVLA